MVTREFFRRWGEYRRLICELNSYSDAELAEPGMARSACARTAFDAASGSPLDDLRRWFRSHLPPVSGEDMFSDRHHTEADRVRCTLGIRRLRAAIAGLALAAAPELPATAHEPYTAYMTPFGTRCCGEDDCAPLADGDVTRVHRGYYINSRLEFVPQVDAQGGPDDRFHICTFKGLRMCFLIPLGHGA